MAAEGLAEVYNSAAFLGKTKGSDLLRYPVPIGAGDVLVLDESSMISTADLALIMDYADRAGALVVPTGDPFQLGPVEAGGMFRALIARAGRGRAVRGAAVRPPSGSGTPRSGCGPVTSPWSRPMTGAAGSGAATGRRPIDRAAGAWLADHLHGRDAILLAGSNEEAAELARRVQAQLVKMGTVVQPRAPLADGNRAGTGDLIRARLNTQDRRRRAAADQPGRAPDRGLAGPGRRGGPQAARRRLVGAVPGAAAPTSPADAELQYAGNIHVAQGRTVDTSHVLVTDTLSRQSFYVGMTRGRESQYRARGDRGNRPGRKGAVRAGDRRSGHPPGHGTGFRGAVGYRADPGQPGMGVRDRARAQPVGGGDARGAQSRD